MEIWYFSSLLFNTVCFRVKTNGAAASEPVVSSSAAVAWLGFPISAAVVSPNNNTLHAAMDVDIMDRREEGDDNGSVGSCSTSGESQEDKNDDGVVVDVVVLWDDQHVTP